MAKSILFILFSILINEVIGQNYYPIKTDSVPEKTYNYYKTLLDKAYEKKDLWNIGVSLANMGEGSKKVFQVLNEAIMENPRKCCFYVHMANHTYQFKERKKIITTLDKLSIKETNKIWEKCKVLMDSTEYIDIYQELSKRNRNKLLPIDSSKLNVSLIRHLESIFEKDQRYRGQIAQHDTIENELWEKQSKLDNENLLDIIIMAEEGDLPSRTEVGDLSYIPWLVLHHSLDIKIKEKFLPLFEQQVKKGDLSKSNLKTYKHRINLYNSNN